MTDYYAYRPGFAPGSESSRQYTMSVAAGNLPGSGYLVAQLFSVERFNI